jgi:hypothetical protein
MRTGALLRRALDDHGVSHRVCGTRTEYGYLATTHQGPSLYTTGRRSRAALAHLADDSALTDECAQRADEENSAYAEDGASGGEDDGR